MEENKGKFQHGEQKDKIFSKRITARVIGPDVQYPSHRKRIANRENKGDKLKKKVEENHLM